MAKKSKLLSALDAHKGRDFPQERQQKLQKAARKRKRDKALANGDEEIGAAGGQEEDVNISDAGDTDEVVENQVQEEDTDEEAEAEDGAEEEDENDIPLSDLSGDDATDVIPHQRLTINNSAAIRASLKRISFINENTPFSEHQSLTSTDEMKVTDPDDDLNRELAFYTVCLSAAKQARGLLKKEGVPFSRPRDYFAEMVKSDEHMGKVKKILFDEAAAKKASAEAKKQRDLKKFGKQVQVAKLQQRQKEKRETLEKINSMKRKRKTGEAGPGQNDDLFDVGLDDTSKPDSRGPQKRKLGDTSTKRQKKDDKFGFGGKKRFSKSGDAASTSDMRGFSVSKMKGKKTGAAKRPGKSRRSSKPM